MNKKNKKRSDKICRIKKSLYICTR